MSYIKFNNTQSRINATVTPISGTVVEVDGNNKNDSGFSLYLDNGMLIGDYNNYTTVYKIIDIDTTQYSNDKSVYVEPIIIEPIIVEPTAEELAEIERQNKIAELIDKISELKYKLKSDDYIIIKLYELSLVGEVSTEYDITTLHTERDSLRAQINELEKELETL